MPESKSARWWPVAKKWGGEIAFWLLLVAAAFYVYRTVSPDIDVSEPLRPAPDFTAQTLSGERFHLSEHRGEIGEGGLHLLQLCLERRNMGVCHL